MKNRRFVHKTLPALTWREWWRLLWIGPISEMVEVEEFLPCGCKNPEYEKATHEETIFMSSNSFKLSEESTTTT